jgi:hypothetical protein
MMGMLRNSRRDFLRLIGLWGWAFVAAARPRSAWSVVTRRSKGDNLQSKLKKLLAHQRSAVVVGRECLRTGRVEAEPQALVDSIGVCCGRGVFDSEGEDLREHLRRGVRKDFEEGNIVEVDGWLLSATEARLSALAALVLDRRSLV